MRVDSLHFTLQTGLDTVGFHSRSEMIRFVLEIALWQLHARQVTDRGKTKWKQRLKTTCR